MSTNAIEVLTARFANREQEFVQSPYWDQIRSSFPLPTPRPEHVYHSPEWWDRHWARHLEWCDRVWPAPAGTGWEVTPVSGVDMTEPIRYNQIKAGKVL